MRVLFVSSGNKTGNGLPIILNQANSLQKNGVELEHFPVIGRGIWGYLRNVRKLRKVYMDGHFDVVHAHYAFNGYLANLAGIRSLVVSIMGSDIQHKWYYPFCVRFFCRLFRWKAIIVKSTEMKQRLNVAKALVIANGVDLSVFKEMERQACRMSLGWDCEKKHILFPGNPKLPRKNWQLARESMAALEKQIKIEGLPWNIEIHPMVGYENTQTPILYNAADVVLLPSFYEGSPNAIKEAMACGTPIVCTDMGDCRERLSDSDSTSGFIPGCYVANAFDSEEIAILLCKSLSFEGKTPGRKKLLEDQLDSNQVAQKLIDIYKDVIRK